jgi:hypothetical protein
MNLQGYTISDKGLPARMAVEGLAKQLKRDFAIGIVVTLVLAFFSDKSPIIGRAALATFGLTFIAFTVRLIGFTKNLGALKCPQCRRILEECKDGDSSYIVCQECRTAYSGYKPSTNPDKMFDEIGKHV